MSTEFSQNAKDKAWKAYVGKNTSKAELSRVFFGKDPQSAFDKVKNGLKKELDNTKKIATTPKTPKTPKTKSKSKPKSAKIAPKK